MPILAMFQSGKAIAGFLLVAGVVLSFVLLNHARKAAEARALNFQTQLALARANENSLQQGIALQNANIVKLQAEADQYVTQQKARDAQVVIQTKQIEGQTTARVKAIQAVNIPTGCTEAIRWANQEASSLSHY